MLCLDALNIAWALSGTIINHVADRYGFGAIDECMRDYGIGTTCIAYVMIFMGYAKIIRFVMYQVCLIHHQKIFGYIEARTRKNRINNDGGEMTTLNFKTIQFDERYLGK